MTVFGDASTPNKEFRNTQYTELDPGPYIGIVKDNVDVTKMGGLKVIIPSLSGTDEGPSSMLYDVKYLTPFYGAKSPSATTKTGPYDFDDSPHSYGMWMVPPDIDTRVLVLFVEGKVSQGYWFGCVQDPYTNHMIPGIAASPHTALGSEEGESDRGVAQKYGTNEVPATEVNRTTWTVASNEEKFDKLKKPIHPFADTLKSQGLITDNVRGTTTSSARRESPSAVFGISTPGRIDSERKKKFKLGPTDANPPRSVVRAAGHTFVMDDGDAAGQNQLIRLRTGSGHQLLMHDTKGVVYLANGSGNVWMEFSADGSIDIYSGGAVALRAVKDINLHSDSNINMFAKGQIKMSALQKLVLDGGMIQTYSDTDTQIQSGGSFTNKAIDGSIISYAGMAQLHMATGPHHLTGEEVHFNTTYTNPNMISTYERTKYYDESGTGTLREDVPEVDLSRKGGEAILQWTPTGNVSMSGMRVPTHEPWFAHNDIVTTFNGTEDDTDADVPGTPGHVAQMNRNNPDENIRRLQQAADLSVHIKKLDIPVTDVKALTQAVENFYNTYTDRFPSTVKQAASSLGQAASSTIQQTVQSITSGTLNALSQQVFVNQAGVLFTQGNLGQAVTGSVTSVLNDLSTGKGVFATAGNLLSAGNVLPGVQGLANQALGGVAKSFNALGGVPGGLGNLQNFANTSLGGLGNLATKGIGNLSGVANQAIGKVAGNVLGKAGNVLGKVNNVAGGLGIANDIYKGVMGKNITSVTQIKSVVGMVGNQITSRIASVGRSIGKIFGF